MFEKVSPGKNLPNDLNVIIEIPAFSNPVKYEVDKESGVLFVDRFMATSMHYPCNYGYVPGTLCKDGDPLDVLVMAPFPLLNGSVIRCRPIGVLEMTDEAGEDSKLLAVPIDKLSSLYKNIKSYGDIHETTLNSIAHFFEHYKDLEQGKWVKIGGWKDVEAAYKEVLMSVERYQDYLMTAV
ncbi:MAG: inorganic diphosphatase [Gammaproteobacteria bacterium]|nr:inorganic diphosphatase [Gammaproteobacteria bacterium]